MVKTRSGPGGSPKEVFDGFEERDTRDSRLSTCPLRRGKKGRTSE